MEITIPAIIILALLLLTTFTISEQVLSSQEAVSESWQTMQERIGEQNRTILTPIRTETTVLGDVVEITLQNNGSTKLADFEQWDVILQYTGNDGYHYAEWYGYGSGQDQWTRTIDDHFEPGILNPGEEVVIEVFISPPAGTASTNVAVVAAPSGISATTVFTH